MLPKRIFTFLVSAMMLASANSLGAQWRMTTGWNNSVNTPPPVSFAADGDTILASGHDDNNYFLMTGILFSTNLGSSWHQIAFSDRSISILSAIGPDLLVNILGSSSLLFSSDFGQHWVQSTFDGLPDTGLNKVSIQNLIASDTQLTILASGIEGPAFYRSTDHGLTWETIKTTGVPSQTYDFSGIFALSGHRLVLPLLEQDSVHFYISNDDGFNWVSQPGYIHCTAFCGLVEIGDQLFFASDSGLSASSDSCKSWVPTIFHRAARSLFAVGNTLFVSVGNYNPYRTEGGIFYSTDLGNDWLDGNRGFDSSDHYADITGVELAVSGQTIFATPSSEPGTFNTGGVWRRPLSDFGITASVATTSLFDHDLSVSPNPLSQSTRISFSSPRSGYAEISIVNLLGAEVARIFSGELAAGEHRFPWEPAGLPDGLYECLVRKNGGVEALPVLLLR